MSPLDTNRHNSFSGAFGKAMSLRKLQKGFMTPEDHTALRRMLQTVILLSASGLD
jgi:hypothetical protein